MEEPAAGSGRGGRHVSGGSALYSLHAVLEASFAMSHAPPSTLLTGCVRSRMRCKRWLGLERYSGCRTVLLTVRV